MAKELNLYRVNFEFIDSKKNIRISAKVFEAETPDGAKKQCEDYLALTQPKGTYKIRNIKTY